MRIAGPAAVCFLGLGFAWAAHAQEQDSAWDLPRGLEFRTESRTEPRPLQLHWLTIEVHAASLEFAVASGSDPDGPGPVEALLTPPQILARDHSAVAMINASAWTMFPNPQTGESPGYVDGGAADVLGWVESRGRRISPRQAGYWSFWMDAQRRLAMVAPDATAGSEESPVCQWAVSGFGGILEDGTILVAASNVRHPRTAIGIDSEGSRMVWLVVDGRQPGYSEGVSERELAELMLEAGCDDALNLDGGGSSVMVLRSRDGELRIANRPSQSTGPRPIPIALVIQRSEQSN